MNLRIITFLSFTILLFSFCQPPKERVKEITQESSENYQQVTDSKAFKITYKGVDFDVYQVDLKTNDVAFYYKDKDKTLYQNFKTLKTDLESQGKELVFATNGGIYDFGNIPKGLYVEDGKKIMKLDRRDGGGNYYLKPNGVFLIFEDNTTTIMETEAFHKGKSKLKRLKHALQSGPLLFSETVDFHPEFNKKSKSKYIRNGVGVLPNGNLVFAISKQTVNLYTFGKFFKEELKCESALYLDGFISKMYLPALDRNHLGGNFAAIIGVTR